SPFLFSWLSTDPAAVALPLPPVLPNAPFLSCSPSRRRRARRAARLRSEAHSRCGFLAPAPRPLLRLRRRRQRDGQASRGCQGQGIPAAGDVAAVVYRGFARTNAS
ncbi:unnamed protein product, partial [Urochloa humidicola]